MLIYFVMFSGEITLVCLGPLTNLALALRLDPLVASYVKEVYIVGGNIEGKDPYLLIIFRLLVLKKICF